jgi:hypothetical protein
MEINLKRRKARIGRNATGDFVMYTNPFSGVGYDLRSLESKIDRKADQHETASLRGDVADLERALRDARAESDELRARVERLEEAVRELNPGLAII